MGNFSKEAKTRATMQERTAQLAKKCVTHLLRSKRLSVTYNHGGQKKLMPTIHWVSGSLVPDAELTCPPRQRLHAGYASRYISRNIGFLFYFKHLLPLCRLSSL